MKMGEIRNIMKFFTPQSGYTLMEVVIVILIASILSFVVVDIIYLQTVNFNQVFNRSIFMGEWRKTLAQLRVDVQELMPANISTMSSNRLTFTNFDGEKIDYEYNSNKLNRNGIVLANWVQADPFQYLDKDENVTVNSDSLTFVRVTLDFYRSGNSMELSELLYVRN